MSESPRLEVAVRYERITSRVPSRSIGRDLRLRCRRQGLELCALPPRSASLSTVPGSPLRFPSLAAWPMIWSWILARGAAGQRIWHHLFDHDERDALWLQRLGGGLPRARRVPREVVRHLPRRIAVHVVRGRARRAALGVSHPDEVKQQRGGLEPRRAASPSAFAFVSSRVSYPDEVNKTDLGLEPRRAASPCPWETGARASGAGGSARISISGPRKV